ncbi:MAG: hypothetical protein K6E99_06065 [Bacilli bacterium]|nr:hypothetical protein [Bacilli bacterium]
MDIEIYKFNMNNRVEIDSDVTFPEDYDMGDIKALKNVHVNGTLSISEYDELEYNLEISGTMVLEDSVTLEETEYSFLSDAEDSAGNYEKYLNKNRNLLDILPILWENIVSEVPIQIKKEGSTLQNVSGNGWEFESNNE